MKAKNLFGALTAAALAVVFTGCTQNAGNGGTGADATPAHTHTYDRQVAEEKYLKSTADCLHKDVYYLSCECGEMGSKTFEAGELGGHNYEDGICKVCNQPDPSVKRKTVTKEEWEKAFDIRIYDNCEVVWALFDKNDPTFDQGNNIRRIDGDKAYFAYIELEISPQPPFEILSQPPYATAPDNEYYFENKYGGDAEEMLYSFEAFYLANLFDRATFDEDSGKYVFIETEERYFGDDGFDKGDKVTISFENGKPVRVDVDYNGKFNDDQAMIFLYSYGGTHIEIPEK